MGRHVSHFEGFWMDLDERLNRKVVLVRMYYVQWTSVLFARWGCGSITTVVGVHRMIRIKWAFCGVVVR